MNLAPKRKLSNEELNIRVAELDNWERLPDRDGWYSHEYWAQFKDGHFCTDTQEQDGLPNYCKDLNAMHEAEVGLSDEQHDNFAGHLLDIVSPNMHWSDAFNTREFVSATARQRAEAFVLTMKETT